MGSATNGTVSISKQGRFKVVLKILAPGSTTKAEGTDTVTGTFGKHGEARGPSHRTSTEAARRDRELDPVS